MIDSYKNIERLRYRLNCDLNEIKESIDKNSNMWYEEMLQQISSAIISAIAAGAITSSEFSTIKDFIVCLLKKICSISSLNLIIGCVLSILVFIGIYIFIYFVIEIVIKKIRHIKKNNDVIRQAKTDYQKEFDNIACDSIFVAFEYKKEYEEKEAECDSLKTFYFYEIVHYLEKACCTTRDLCKYKEKYIKINGRPSGVDIYRIYNMIDLMNELLRYIEKEQKNIKVSKQNKEKIKNAIDDIATIIQNDIIENVSYFT